ncbi:hypothetical protein J6590_097569 [Homalodisca vitripennis]|nr:hypothetical protein J6590_097569 [Homalodisca vitripennis]
MGGIATGACYDLIDSDGTTADSGVWGRYQTDLDRDQVMSFTNGRNGRNQTIVPSFAESAHRFILEFP